MCVLQVQARSRHQRTVCDESLNVMLSEVFICAHTQTCTWHTCHTRHACQCDTWREMCTWSHRITNNAPIQSSTHDEVNIRCTLLHITMPWNNSRRLKMNKVSRWRLSDQLMLHARKCYIVQSHAWVLHAHLHTCVSTVFLVRIFIMQYVWREMQVYIQCACILYMFACISPNVLAVLYVVSWCTVYPVHEVCTAAAGGVKLVVCAIVHNRNVVVCPCVCTCSRSLSLLCVNVSVLF